MALHEDKGANGKIELYYHLDESSSGHVEDESGAELIAHDKNTILLKQYKKHTNYIKSSGSSASEEKYLINIGDLIASIKEKGEKIK